MAAAKESIPATGPSIPNIRKFKGKLICKDFAADFFNLRVPSSADFDFKIYGSLAEHV